MKKWIAVILTMMLACTACFAFAETEDSDAIVDRGNEALVAEDYATALEQFTKAADLGNSRAVNNLGWVYDYGLGVEQDYKKAFEYYSKAAEMGNPLSFYSLGILYYEGLGTEKDYGKCFENWMRSAELGYAPAYEAVGELYRDGLSVEQDYGKAADWFHKAVEMGETDEAQVNYDKLIEEGKIPKDYTPKEITFETK